MPKHVPVLLPLRQVVAMIPPQTDSTWYDTMGVDIPGLDDIKSRIVSGMDDDAWDDLNDEIIALSDSYLESHGSDAYLVSWPELVSFPRFNSDANYQPQ